MEKYRICLDLDLYAETPADALKRARLLFRDALGQFGVMANHPNMLDSLPTGGMAGEPHEDDKLTGWKCVFSLDKV